MRKKYSLIFRILSILLVVCMLSAVMVGCRKKNPANDTTGTTGDSVSTGETNSSLETNSQTQSASETDETQETFPSGGDSNTKPTTPAPTTPAPTTPAPTTPAPTTPATEETVLAPQPLSTAYYNGKTGVFIGDSITNGIGASSANTKYVKLLADKLGLASIKNLGSNGTTLCTGPSLRCNFEKLTLANCSDAAVVTIMLGTNDFNYAKADTNAMGTFLEDSTSTVYGALHRWCKEVVALRNNPACKDTKFFFVTPIPGLVNLSVVNNTASGGRHGDQNKVNAAGWTMRDYCEAMLKTCDYYKIPVLDLNRYGNLYFKNANEDHLTQYLSDYVHPNDAGHAQIAEDLYQFLLMNPTYVAKSTAGNPSYIASDFASKLVDRLQCTVTFDSKGHGTQPQAIRNTNRLPESLPVLSAPGYTFQGWYFKAERSKEVKATANQPIGSDIILYAKWAQN